MRVHVVGLNLDDAARQQLLSVADAGNGDNFDASDYTSLANSLEQVVHSVHQTVAEVQPKPKVLEVECEPTIETETTPSPEPTAKDEKVDDYEPDRLINPVSGGEDLETAVILEAGHYTFEEHLPA